MSATRVLNRKHTRQKMCESEKICRSLFETDKEFIYSIPFHKKHLMGHVKTRIATYLFLTMPSGFHVTTRCSDLEPVSFFRTFSENILDSTLIWGLLELGLFNHRMHTPDTLYHGTTTMFLPNIRKEGLLLSKAGLVSQFDVGEVCLTDSICSAVSYAAEASRKFNGHEAVLCIDTQGLKQNFSHVNGTYFRGRYSPNFCIYTEFSLKEAIPPQKIKNWYILSEDPSLSRLIDSILLYGSERAQRGDGFWD